MKRKHHTTATFIAVWSTVAAIILAVLLLAPTPDADAHAFRPNVCGLAWQNAPDGHRWEARQACRRYVAAHRHAHQCRLPLPLVPPTTTVKGARATNHQRMVLTIALNTAHHAHATVLTMVAMTAAITQESTARNIPYGHGTSVGILQLIDIHGTVAWRMHIPNSAGWFIRGAAHHQTLPPAQLAQAVQRSAYPSAYSQWVPEARRTVRAYLRTCPRG